MSRARRARAETAAREPEVVRGDRVARWRCFEHRGTKLTFVMSGIVVEATNSTDLVEKTERQIVARTRNAIEN